MIKVTEHMTSKFYASGPTCAYQLVLSTHHPASITSLRSHLTDVGSVIHRFVLERQKRAYTTH